MFRPLFRPSSGIQKCLDLADELYVFISIWIHIDIVLNFAIILRLKLCDRIVSNHDVS
jgi:hypothetical protein